MLAGEIAQYLHDQGIGNYVPSGVGGDIFIELLPSSPDECIAIYSTGGVGSDGKLGYDTPTIQIIVRGTRDPRGAYNRAQQIYSTLHGLHHITLPSGTWLVNCLGIQSGPIHLGTDENQRHEYSLNFQLEIRALTAHRE